MKFKFFLDKEKVRDIIHWAIFVMVAVTITLKIVEVSAYESLQLLIENPDAAQYSYLVK